MTYYEKKLVIWLDREGLLLPGEEAIPAQEHKRRSREREKETAARLRGTRRPDSYLKHLAKMRDLGYIKDRR